MKILMSADAAGGVWDYTVTLSRALSDLGHEVFVAVLGHPSQAQLSTLSPGVTWRSEELRLEWMPGGLRDLPAASLWIAEMAAEWDADVVHLNQLACTPVCGAPTLLVAHSDVLSWYSEARGGAPPPEWRAYAEAVRAGLGAARMVITPSAYQSELLLRHYGRPAERVIRNAARPSGGWSHARVATERATVLMVGRAWDPAKGAATLDRALGRLGADAPEAHLLGATVGPSGERFEPEHLTAHGHVGPADVSTRMRRAGIYVGPSLYEPFGLAPLEAALHGCALVLASIGSFRELWDGCAAFFPAGDDAALAEVLRHLAGRPEVRAELAARALARARERYTPERMAGEYLEAYAAVRRNTGRDDQARTGGSEAAAPAAGAA